MSLGNVEPLYRKWTCSCGWFWAVTTTKCDNCGRRRPLKFEQEAKYVARIAELEIFVKDIRDNYDPFCDSQTHGISYIKRDAKRLLPIDSD